MVLFVPVYPLFQAPSISYSTEMYTELLGVQYINYYMQMDGIQCRGTATT